MALALPSLLLAAILTVPSWAAEDAPDKNAELGAKALGLLHRATHSEDPDLRLLVAEQWGLVGNQAAVPVLRKMLADPNRQVRIAAAGALFQLGDRSGVATLEAIIRERPKAGKQDSELLGAIEELRAMARNKARVSAIQALSQMYQPGSVKVFVEAKQDAAGSVRDAAAAALARLGGKEELARFVAALDSEDPGERLAAVKVLGDVATPIVIVFLQKRAKDTEYGIRAAVMEGLGAVGEAEVIPTLDDGLDDQNDLVRSKAAAALVRVNSPSAAASLRKAQEKSTLAFIQLMATGGLARLGQDIDLGLAQRSLSQPDVDTKVLAVEVLEAAGSFQSWKHREVALEHLTFALEDVQPRVRLRAAAALVKLLAKKK